ncbi:MAG: hypothetical protein ACRDEA_05420, partial [Microcystaceae cyanobacterium]
WWDNPLNQDEEEKDKIKLTLGDQGLSQSINIGNGLSMDLEDGSLETDIDKNYKMDFNGNLKRKL